MCEYSTDGDEAEVGAVLEGGADRQTIGEVVAEVGSQVQVGGGCDVVVRMRRVDQRRRVVRLTFLVGPLRLALDALPQLGRRREQALRLTRLRVVLGRRRFSAERMRAHPREHDGHKQRTRWIGCSG